MLEFTSNAYYVQTNSVDGVFKQLSDAVTNNTITVATIAAGKKFIVTNAFVTVDGTAGEGAVLIQQSGASNAVLAVAHVSTSITTNSVNYAPLNLVLEAGDAVKISSSAATAVVGAGISGYEITL
jgi:hypothetical protein